MKRFFVFASFAAFAAVSLALPADAQQKAKAPVKGFAPVKLPELSLVVLVPAGYQRVSNAPYRNPASPNENPGNPAIYVGPTTKELPSKIILKVQSVSPGDKVDVALVRQMKEGFKNATPSYQETETGTVMVGGETGAFVTATFLVQGHPVKEKRMLVVHGTRGYSLSFASSASMFAKQAGAFDKMVASLKWL